MDELGFLLVVYAGFYSLLFIGAIRIKVEPQIAFPVDGTSFKVKCYADGKKDQQTPNARFVDINSRPYTNTSTRWIIVNRNEDEYQENITMVWDPITLKDMKTINEEKSACAVASLGAQFSVFVIPKESKPRISVSPRLPITVTSGSDVQFECHAAVDVLDKVKNFTMEWKFNGSNIFSLNRTKIEYKYEVLGRSVLGQSRLILLDVKEDDTGTYYCIANLKVSDGQDKIHRSRDAFYETFKITKVVVQTSDSNDMKTSHSMIFGFFIIVLSSTIF